MKSHLLNAVCNSFRLCLLSLPLVMPSPSPAALVDLNAAKDNTIYFQSLPSPGSGTGSRQGAGEAIFVGASGAGVVQRGLIAFDLNAIPAGSTINSATLTMDVNRISSNFTGSMDIDLRRLTSDWAEGSESSAGPYGGGGDGAPPLPHGMKTSFHLQTGSRLVVTSLPQPVPPRQLPAPER